MNKYEELIYNLIYNCNRELTTEEKKILNQASAIYNTYNNLTDELGCPLEVVIKALKYGIYIKNIDGEMVNFKCELYYKNPELGWYFLIINGYVPLTDYKTKFWLKKDKSE